MSEKKETALQVISKGLKAQSVAIKKLLPPGVSVERWERIAFKSIQASPYIQKCTTNSIILSCLHAAELGLDPGGMLGEAYLIPYNDKCTLQIGYKGLRKLAFKSGEVLDITAKPILKGDTFSVQEGTDPKIEHSYDIFKRVEETEENVVAFYSVAFLKNGVKHFDIMSKAAVDKIRSRSQAAKSGSSPWHTDYIEMGKKSIFKRNCKLVPMGPQLEKAIAADNAAESGQDAGAIFEIDSDNIIDAEYADTPQTQMARLKAEAERAKAEKDAATAHPELKAEPVKPKRGRPKKEQPEAPVMPPEPPKEPEASKDIDESESVPQEANGLITAQQMAGLDQICRERGLILMKIIGDQPISEIKVSTAETLLQNIIDGSYDMPEFKNDDDLELG